MKFGYSWVYLIGQRDGSRVGEIVCTRGGILSPIIIKGHLLMNESTVILTLHHKHQLNISKALLRSYAHVTHLCLFMNSAFISYQIVCFPEGLSESPCHVEHGEEDVEESVWPVLLRNGMHGRQRVDCIKIGIQE